MTKEAYDGYQRQLAWFSRQMNGLYFEVFGLFMGSHTSYHKDGKIMRTSPAITRRDKHRGTYLPLDDFRGLYQLGAMMTSKSELRVNPCLKEPNRRKALIVYEVDLNKYPSQIMNCVVEFLEPASVSLIKSKDLAPPPNADVIIIDSIEPWIVLTILGNEHNLLIKPSENGFVVSHLNDRYTLNAPGVEYTFEAYG